MPKILTEHRLNVPANGRLTIPLPNSRAIFEYESLIAEFVGRMKKIALDEAMSEDEKIARQYLLVRQLNSRVAGAVVVANPGAHNRLSKVVNFP